MSTPNPLIPQGTFQAQAAKGASNVRLAVATIVAIHVVFFGGLLLQGCKREPGANAAASQETNTVAVTNPMALPALDSNSLFYPTGGVPSETGTGVATQVPATDPFAPSTIGGGMPSEPTNAEALWQSSNLAGNSEGTLTSTAEATGLMKEYTIVRGDTLGAIANRNGTTLSALMEANPGIEPRRIRPGQKLQIPAAEKSPTAGTGSSNGGSGSGKTYTVKSGDTLTKIARDHRITVGQLRAANDLRTSLVRVGQKLKIPAGTNSNTGSGATPAPNGSY
jgi:LysM repeat protein